VKLFLLAITFLVLQNPTNPVGISIRDCSVVLHELENKNLIQLTFNPDKWTYNELPGVIEPTYSCDLADSRGFLLLYVHRESKRQFLFAMKSNDWSDGPDGQHPGSHDVANVWELVSPNP